MNLFFAKLPRVGAILWALLPLFAGGLLAACGGGGEETSNPPGGPGNALRLVVSAQSVSTQGSSTGAASSRTIPFSLQNYSAGDSIHIVVSFTNSAVQTVEHVISGAAGTLTIHFKPASMLTPGAYTDTVNLVACRESPCVNHLPGSPHAIAVAHAVPTQTAPPPPPPPPSTPQLTLVLSQTAVHAEAMTYTAAPVRTVGITLDNLGAQGVFVGGSYSTNGILAPSLAQTGAITMTLSIPFKDPTTLGAGTYTDTITLRACTESPCVNHIAGSPQVITITYVVTENPDPPTVTFSTNAVSRTAVNDPGNSATLTVDPISFAVANAPIETPITRLTFSGAAVSGAVVGMSSPQQGTVQLWLKEPAALGAGTYHSTVQVQVCFDSGCARQLAGSPHAIDVTYVVTGSSHPATRITWSEGLVSGASMNTSETRTPQIHLTPWVTHLPPAGLYIRHAASASGLITSVGGDPPSRIFHIASANESFPVVLRPPATLGSGYFTDSMMFEACFDAACTEIVPDSRFMFTPAMFVMVTEGVEFTRQNYPLGGNADAVLWSPVDSSLYVAASGPPGAPRVLRLDPAAMAVTATATLDFGSLHRLAVTDDASYLYVGSNLSETVQRLRLPDLAPDLTVQLGRFSDTRPYTTGDIDTLPGEPQSFVATVKFAGDHVALRVYDDAVPRPVTVEPVAPRVEQQRWLVPAAAPGTFISRNYGGQPLDNALERLVVDAAGIRVDSSSPMPVDRHVIGHPHRAGTRLFHAGSSILDADTGALVDTLVLPGTGTPWQVLPDERNRRLFVAMNVQGRSCLISYDLDTLELLAFAPIETSFTSSMVLWGEDGLAFTNGHSVTVVSGTFFSSYRGEPTQ